MGDMGDEDGFFDASSEPTPASKAPSSKPTSSNATPFDDGAEPDFAGWLAAQQQQKKSSIGKTLPKGLSKPSGAGAKKPLASRPAAKPVVAKKIDMKPKETDDDDGWGDGW